MEVEKFWILLKCQPRDAYNSTTFLCQGDQMSNLRLLHFPPFNGLNPPQIVIITPNRYKLFVINKNTFDSNFSLEDYGINLAKQNNKFVVDDLKWNSLAKKHGFETDDIIKEFKIENLNRPNKALVYPFALILLLSFGYLNYRRKEKDENK